MSLNPYLMGPQGGLNKIMNEKYPIEGLAQQMAAPSTWAIAIDMLVGAILAGGSMPDP